MGDVCFSFLNCSSKVFPLRRSCYSPDSALSLFRLGAEGFLSPGPPSQFPSPHHYLTPGSQLGLWAGAAPVSIVTWATPDPCVGEHDSPCVPWGCPQPPRASSTVRAWHCDLGCTGGLGESTLLLGTSEGLRATCLPERMAKGSVKPALCFPAVAVNVQMLPRRSQGVEAGRSRAHCTERCIF